ncbi:amidohydrolase 2 [Rhodovulum sp. PH10]|uniref:hypothetical protein n=1 Tax=Rhodovulum sp. PH10 TaxID=1187851 RepID=UPI00027C268C|nr:hypothetical protein [Rhodovulum sp. PH10]EJW11363.1 amidohydrolase 2 [Rhodovulum sp. PH10]
MPDYLAFDPNPRSPSEPPPHTCDARLHVLGPLSEYPVRPEAAHRVPTATPDAEERQRILVTNPAKFFGFDE